MSTRRGAFKVTNEYSRALGALYGAPKAVIAAVAVSMLTTGGDRIDEAQAAFAEEWEALHRAGIVPQPPSKVARALLAPSSAAPSAEAPNA